MRKLMIITLILCVVLSMTASGQGMKGKMLVSGYGGYTLGFGDVFSSESGATYEYSFKPGINLGGIFHYGVSDKFMIGGELGFQSYLEKYSYGDVSESETYGNFNLLLNGLYVLNHTENVQSIFITFGAGSYGFGEGEYATNEIGVFGGVIYQRMIIPTVGLMFMPRFHYVFAEDVKPMMLSLSVGVCVPVGRKS